MAKAVSGKEALDRCNKMNQMRRKGMSQHQIARHFKIGQPQVTRFLALRHLTKVERQAVLDGRLGSRLAMDLARADDKLRNKIIKLLVKGEKVTRKTLLFGHRAKTYQRGTIDKDLTLRIGGESIELHLYIHCKPGNSRELKKQGDAAVENIDRALKAIRQHWRS